MGPERKLKKSVFEMFKHRNENDMFMDDPEYKSWKAGSLHSDDGQRKVEGVSEGAEKQSRMTVDMTGHFESETTFKCN